MAQSTQVVRVLIVDDHPLFREGLRSRLERQADFKVVGEAGDGDEAVAAVERCSPDLVLMDLRMPGVSGLEALVHIKEGWPAVQVVVLTVEEDDEVLLQAIQAGAAGYLSKASGAGDLVPALRTVLSGNSVFAPELLRRAVESAVSETAVDPAITRKLAELTGREREVLVLLSQGLSNRDIAERLVVVEATVKKHVHGVLQKLGVSDRTQAALLAVRAGITH